MFLRIILPCIAILLVNGCQQISAPGASAPVVAGVGAAPRSEPKLLARGAGGRATGDLKVYMLNVGQADAIYIECPEAARHNMLIDSGDTRYPGSSKQFRAQLTELLGDKKRIDVVVASHPHADHIGSLSWVFENFAVGKYIDDGMAATTALHKKVNATAQTRGVHVLHATDLENKSKEPDFCPAMNLDAILVKPQGFGRDSDPNNNSVVIRLNYNDQTFLFVGDSETNAEKLLLNDPATKPLLRANVLKSPHHGSDTSSSPDFLTAVSPTMFIVSAGEKEVSTNKGYRHPRAVTIKRYFEFTKGNGKADVRVLDVGGQDAKAKDAWSQLEINAGIYVTSVDGTILLTSDGSSITKDANGAGLASEGSP